MDSIALAMLTSSLTLIAKEAAKAVSSQAAKDLWSEAKKMLGFQKEPSEVDLARQIAETLNGDENLAAKVAKLVQDQGANVDDLKSAVSIITGVNAKKFVSIGSIGDHATISL